ncbi:MAG TPA: hypothetical protein V6C89_12595 [Drouetiella sp.]
MVKVNNSKLFRLSTLPVMRAFFASLICFALSATPVIADRIVPFSDDWFNRQFDWVVYMSLSPMDNFLKYPGSTMSPIMRVPVEYRYSPNRTFRKSYPLERQKYEEIWYHDGRAVGLRRYKELNLSQQEQGAVYITPNPRNGQNVPELTNALVRLVLDIYAKRTILATIVVPQELFENFANALAQYNFFKLTIVYPGGPGNNMSIHLVSEPFGTERYFYYDDSGRR